MTASIISFTTILPNKELFPNRKNGKHWGSVHSFKQQDLAQGFYDCKQVIQVTKPFTIKNELLIELSFYYADKRHRDTDNILSAFKAIQDGIFKALEIDDKQVTTTIVRKKYDKLNPRCEVIITSL